MSRKKKTQVNIELLLRSSARGFLELLGSLEPAIQDKRYWGQVLVAQMMVRELMLQVSDSEPFFFNNVPPVEPLNKQAKNGIQIVEAERPD